MTAREEMQAIERRLAEIDRALEDHGKALVEEEHLDYRHPRRPEVLARILDMWTQQQLFLERERLQEESFRIFQQLRAEGR